MRVGIIGGSIAGCAAAVLPHRAGHDITVFERSASGSATDAANPCTLTGSTLADHCWRHWPSTWASTSAMGTGVFAYAAGAADPGWPGVPASYEPVRNDISYEGGPCMGNAATSPPSPL